jgi:hypothetical protein
LETHDHGPEIDELWTQYLRVMRIIVVALIGGVAAFCMVVLATFESAADSLGLVGSVALGVAVLSIMVKLVVPGMIGSAKNGSPLTELVGLYQVRLIIGLSVLEGAALLNLVAFQAEQHWSSLVAAGVLVLFMLASWPSRAKIESWIKRQQEMAELG